MKEIPEKWSLLRNTKNHIIVNKWCDEFTKRNSGTWFQNSEYVNCNYIGNKLTTDMFIKQDYVEITFEYFEKFILNKQPLEQINNSYSLF